MSRPTRRLTAAALACARAGRAARRHVLLPAAVAAAALAGCATGAAPGSTARTAEITRTAHGIAHIAAPDLETLAYGVAYAHAQDNVCQTAQQLVTVRGQRSRFFGGTAQGQLGLRMLPNDQSDLFIAAHMDDARLARAAAAGGEDLAAMTRGYVAGYNRYLADQAAALPAACRGQAWVRPMTEADYRRLLELSAVQAGIAALADGVVGAQPPRPAASQAPAPRALAGTPTTAADLAPVHAWLEEIGLKDPPIGSNAWAFGRDTTANGRGLLLGNPHFPWVGVNRFWQMHLTVPGRFDVMGASIGHTPVVQIGFNRDVAWSHTVSTGKRFTLHELKLQPGDPTVYLIDGKPEKMVRREVSILVRDDQGLMSTRVHPVWSTRWGPVVIAPRAGLNWTATTAYAIQDANAGNLRSAATWLSFAAARSVDDLREGMKNLGVPWVNTIAADRHGRALYADVSVVPDVDAARLAACAPSPAAAALFRGAGLAVLDGSRAACDWQRDPASPVPGLTPIARMPVAVRTDWVQNSNDSFVHTHPAQRFEGISPMVGDASVNRPRTRASHTEIPLLLARGKVDAAGVQRQLFANRNLIGETVMPDLLAACESAPPAAAGARDGCAALKGWDRTSNGESRGAHLFREFWRAVRTVPKLHRVPFDPARPIETPTGLAMGDAEVAAKVWDALDKSVAKVRAAGFALDAPLASVQRSVTTDEAIGLHGGDETEGVLNNLGDRGAPGIGPQGIRIDYGTSYVQTVGFDERGPVAQALLTYGQSSERGSPHATDQLRLFEAKRWPALPFHPEDVARAKVGEVLRLVRP
jgi:acyl-homoserine-lactone acylase